MGSFKSPLGYIINIVLYGLTLIAAIMLVVALLAGHVAPETMWWPAIIGLGAPIVIVVNVLIMLYWVLRWKAIALVPLIVLVAGFSGVSRYISPSLMKDYPHSGKNSFRVATYNVRGFESFSTPKRYVVSEPVVDSIAAFTKNNEIDIFCMQEFRVTSNDVADHIDTAFGRFKYKSIKFVARHNELGTGLAIYSRYPIVDSKIISSNKRVNGAMYADIVVKGDTIRVFNNHLQTSSVDIADRAFVAEVQVENLDSAAIDQSKNIVRKLRANNTSRQHQVDSIAPLIEQSPYPQIVCGDFNDVPSSYAYQKMRGDLQDTFIERGKGYGYTFKEFMQILRIDYIFASEKIDVLTYKSPNIEYSDHNPVISLLEIKKEE